MLSPLGLPLGKDVGLKGFTLEPAAAAAGAAAAAATGAAAAASPAAAAAAVWE